MVYHGPSGGCLTCKSRRKKCDGTKPTCLRCQKSKRACGGYLAHPKETFFVAPSTSILPFSSLARKCTLPLATDAQLQEDAIPREATDAVIDEVALRSFVYEFCLPGAEGPGPGGFLAGLEEILLRQPLDSVLVRACQALSHGLTGRQKNRSLVTKRGRLRYEQVVSRFAREIAEPGFVFSVDAVLTAMLLGLHEVVVADKTWPSSLHDHVQGMMAILHPNKTPSEIARLLRSDSPTQRRTTCTIELLDVASSVDSLRLRLSHLRLAGCSSDEALHLIQREATSLQQRLQAWQSHQPELYRPRSIGQISPSSALSSDTPSIGRWPGSVDTYFDLAVAETWNLFRVAECTLAVLFAELASSRPDEHGLKQVENAVQGVLSSVPYHCFEDPRQVLRKSVEEIEALSPGNCIGGTLIMQHLCFLSRLYLVPDNAKEYIRCCLEWIGQYMGIGQAAVFAKDCDNASTMQDLEDIRMLITVGLLV